jgi:hypothetical protein
LSQLKPAGGYIGSQFANNTDSLDTAVTEAMGGFVLGGIAGYLLYKAISK